MRINKASKTELSKAEDIFTQIEAMTGFVPNSLQIMARRPTLLQGFNALAMATAQQSELDPTLSLMIGHIASTAAGCMYCQAHTAAKISQNKDADKKLNVIWEFESSELFNDAERAALRFAREASLLPNGVTGTHFTELKSYYSDEQILDMLAIVCLYGWLNRWNDTLATPLEDQPLDVAQNFLSNRGWQAGKHLSE